MGILCVVAAGWAGPQASAQGIYSNAINDPNPSTANPFTAGDTLDPNLTATGIGRGPGVNANAGSNRYNATAWSFPALDTSDYFTWTITPAAGYEINFSDLVGTWQRSGTGPKSYVLESSRDNFATPIFSGDITGSAQAVAYSIDLSSLQNVDSAIEFRLFAYNGTGGTGTFSINDFEFDGTVQPGSVGPQPLAGDYNNDGLVDASDYVTWRHSATSGTPLLFNETASPGTTDAADYDAWRANFGGSQAGGGASLSSTATTVPEPTSILLALIFGISASPMLRLRKS